MSEWNVVSAGRPTFPRWISWGNDSMYIVFAVSTATGCHQSALLKRINWVLDLNNISSYQSLIPQTPSLMLTGSVQLESTPLCVLKKEESVCIGEGILSNSEVHRFRNNSERKLRLSFGAQDASLCHVLGKVNFIFQAYMDCNG